MKKTIALFLSILMALSVFLPISAFAAGPAAPCDCDDTPIVYINGRTITFRDPSLCSWDNETKKVVSPEPDLPHVEDDYIVEQVKRVLPIFLKAVATNKYDEWKKEFVGIFEEIYKDFALDENGEIHNNSGIYWNFWPNTLPDTHRIRTEITNDKQANEYIYNYRFVFDYRVNPFDHMEKLHSYIESVKYATGHDTVKIICRCFGTNLLVTYLATYGWDDIESIVIYNPAMNGTLVSNALFTGEIATDVDQLNNFVAQELDDDALMSFLKIYVTFLTELKALNIPVATVNSMAKKLVPMVLPDVLKVSYGTLPGYWAMISTEKYEQAKNYVFSTDEDKVKFAGLIEKIDTYYNTIGKNIPSILKEASDDGVYINVIAKTGMQAVPISKQTKIQSDRIVSAYHQSMGATTTEIGTVFSKDYIAKAEENGTAKYISYDKTVDASTALFPDKTWFIKDLEHGDYPQICDLLTYKLCKNPEMTVWDDSAYPQYLVYKEATEQAGESLTPMAENNLGRSYEKPNIFKAFFETVKKFFTFIILLIKGEYKF